MHRSAISKKAHTALSGQACFIRALCYFYLVNIYGDVPLITTTNVQQTATQPRTPSGQVYQQVITDLLHAQASLPDSYDATDSLQPGRVWATQWAATALLARVYLYQSDWNNAAIQASSVIGKGPFSLTGNLGEVFLPKSKETILQFQPVNSNTNSSTVFNTGDGGLFLASPSPGKPPALVLTTSLLNTFEANDARKSAWIKTSRSMGRITTFLINTRCTRAVFALHRILHCAPPLPSNTLSAPKPGPGNRES